MRGGARWAMLVLPLVMLAVPFPASAGGWWSYIELNNRYLAPGTMVHSVGTRIFFDSVREAHEARRGGSYYAYLIEDFDYHVVTEAQSKMDPSPRWWRIGDAAAMRVGRVSLGGWDANLATATARFVAPDVTPGPYVLMFCDAGCKRPLADLVPRKVRVVADPLTARIVGTLERVQNRTALQYQRLLYRERHLAARTGAALGRMQARIGALEGGLERALIHPAGPNEPSGSPWWGPVGWYLAGAMTVTLAALVLRRRPRRPSALPERWNERAPQEELLVRPRGR
jgi:hypothetical protein